MCSIIITRVIYLYTICNIIIYRLPIVNNSCIEMHFGIVGEARRKREAEIIVDLRRSSDAMRCLTIHKTGAAKYSV